MEFCENCGALMRVRETMLVCSCGNLRDMTKRQVIRETIRSNQAKRTGILEDSNPLATYPHTCKKCGHDKAQILSKGVWVSDEDEVVEYVCGKCGFHERAEGLKIG